MKNSNTRFCKLGISRESGIIIGTKSAALYQHQISGYPRNNSPKVNPVLIAR